MGLISNAQSFLPGTSGVLDNGDNFRRAMDTVLTDIGRDITVHLEPSKQPCVAPDCRFDAFYKKYVSTNGIVCSTCKGQGFIIEPNYTIYRANIRWTDEPFNKGSGPLAVTEPVYGRLGYNFVRTKTTIESFEHIKSSIGATIDGVRVQLFEEPRQTGWGPNLLYVVAFWKVINSGQ